ncbi:hypothetical protein [Paraburkholderia youngii]|uniref:hypothetical protein n=1 Tax=Paraburkholderia youngii TaxID=2782701 RepID=UPI003D242864
MSIAFYAGAFAETGELVQLCDVEGSVVPDNGPLFALLEEVSRVLAMCAEKYAAPCASGERFVVLIGRKTGVQLQPLARLDVDVSTRGLARARVMYADGSCTDIDAACEADDDVVATVLKILEARTGGPR